MMKILRRTSMTAISVASVVVAAGCTPTSHAYQAGLEAGNGWAQLATDLNRAAEIADSWNPDSGLETIGSPSGRDAGSICELEWTRMGFTLQMVNSPENHSDFVAGCTYAISSIQ